MNGGFQRLQETMERRQRQAADFLNRKTARLGRKQWIMGLALFCLLFGGASIYTIWQSMVAPVATIGIERVSVPAHATLPVGERPSEAELTGQELGRILWFRHFLDSLQQSESGKAIYDSFARHRPGLLDSLAFIERVYQLPLKTSEDGKEK